MKIMHVVGGRLSGGAARGAYWLHKGLAKAGIDSRILTNSGDTFEDPSVVTIAATKQQKLHAFIRSHLDQVPAAFYPERKKDIFSASFVGYDFTKHSLYKWADIVHLHWINDGFVNIKHLSGIEKPVVWTMRDMWPMTGGCHYSMECENYKSGCGNCEQLNSKKKRDLSRWILNRKIKYYPRQMKIVGISRWISEKAKESRVFLDFDVRTIPNCIDCEEFFPVDKAVARKMLGIAVDKKIILAGAQNIKDTFKGFDRYLEAVKSLDTDKYFLSFFGKLDTGMIKDLGFEYKNLGFLNDFVSLRLAYSAADVFVMPSIADAFGKTLAEAMACGTPAVCFDATGPKDVVDHKENGYKAVSFDANDLAQGIDWVVDSPDYGKLRQNAREKILREFEMVKVAHRYKKLYEEILGA